MKNILIGGAWPYANGSLHIGHIAALLPGDVLARYWRARGAQVFYVSGSDCHGTPITLRAQQEGTNPADISEQYHREFCETFEKLGFSYDLYTKTTAEHHIAFVQDFHRTLYNGPYVKPRTVQSAWCPQCKKVLTDRMIVGTCPVCGNQTRGEQCDSCHTVPEPECLVNPACAICASPLELRETTQLYLLTSGLQTQLQALLDTHPNWRRNAIAFTQRYLHEGLRDRAITRDLDWGIPVPLPGYEDKKIYIWAENVLGYLSAGTFLCKKRGVNPKTLFGPDARHYYVHGKDNIPFHTIILPALLLAHGQGLHLPDDVISSEHMTLEGEKISTSRNHAVWADELLAHCQPDTIRYCFLINGPEKRDADFSWKEFAQRNNTDLVGAWGNFVNRTLAFTAKYLDNTVPKGTVDAQLQECVQDTFDYVGSAIEDGRFRDALFKILELVHLGNRYYDQKSPWKTRTESPIDCADTIYNCTRLIGNLAVLLQPFLPFTSKKVLAWLGMQPDWHMQEITSDRCLPELSVLFGRISPDELKHIMDKR